MSVSKDYSFEIEHYYSAIDPQKFWDFFVDHEWYSKSDIMPGVVAIDKPGAGHPQGLGAVRTLKIDNIQLTEDIVGFRPPHYFGYAVHEGGMPVKHYQGEFFFEPKDGGMLWRYRGQFDRKFFGTGLFFRYVLKSRMKGMIPTWEKAYHAYYESDA